MPEVEVGLRAVLGDVHLTVLVGAHRAGVDVDVRVEFLRGDLQPARFEQPTEAGGGNAFPEPGNHTARDKNVLGFFHFIYLHFGITQKSAVVGTNHVFRDLAPTAACVHRLLFDVVMCVRFVHPEVRDE